ncbi:MAG: methylmalonyl-CoA epimerase [Candidatus Methylomirabilota bacterium]
MFVGAHHVAIAVKELEKALGFYRDVLGLHVSTKEHVAEQGVMAALLPLSNGEIELLEPTNPAGGVAKFVEKRGEGPHHLCVQTTDIAGAIEQAKAAGLPLIDQAPRKGLAGTIGFLHPGASQGVLVEMAQPGEAGTHWAPSTDGIAAHTVETVYIAVKDVEAAKQVYEKNFEAAVESDQQDPWFKTRAARIRIGKNSVTLLDAGALEAQPPAERFLAGRCEGLLGIGLRTADYGAAVGHLKSSAVAVDERAAAAGRLARIDSDRTHGVNLYLC